MTRESDERLVTQVVPGILKGEVCEGEVIGGDARGYDHRFHEAQGLEICEH